MCVPCLKGYQHICLTHHGRPVGGESIDIHQYRSTILKMSGKINAPAWLTENPHHLSYFYRTMWSAGQKQYLPLGKGERQTWSLKATGYNSQVADPCPPTLPGSSQWALAGKSIESHGLKGRLALWRATILLLEHGQGVLGNNQKLTATIWMKNNCCLTLKVRLSLRNMRSEVTKQKLHL